VKEVLPKQPKAGPPLGVSDVLIKEVQSWRRRGSTAGKRPTPCGSEKTRSCVELEPGCGLAKL
jgi:hypothetical protein